MHGTGELHGNLEVLTDLIRVKPDITEASLLPDIHAKDAALKVKFYPDGWKFHDKAKNADCVLTFRDGQEWVIDFKRLEGNGKHIAPHLEKAAGQADYAVIKLSNIQQEGAEGVRRTVSKKLESTKLKGVVVINGDGCLLYEEYKNTIGD